MVLFAVYASVWGGFWLFGLGWVLFCGFGWVGVVVLRCFGWLFFVFWVGVEFCVTCLRLDLGGCFWCGICICWFWVVGLGFGFGVGLICFCCVFCILGLFMILELVCVCWWVGYWFGFGLCDRVD